MRAPIPEARVSNFTHHAAHVISKGTAKYGDGLSDTDLVAPATTAGGER